MLLYPASWSSSVSWVRYFGSPRYCFSLIAWPLFPAHDIWLTFRNRLPAHLQLHPSQPSLTWQSIISTRRALFFLHNSMTAVFYSFLNQHLLSNQNQYLTVLWYECHTRLNCPQVLQKLGITFVEFFWIFWLNCKRTATAIHGCAPTEGALLETDTVSSFHRGLCWRKWEWDSMLKYLLDETLDKWREFIALVLWICVLLFKNNNVRMEKWTWHRKHISSASQLVSLETSSYIRVS